MLEFVTKLDNRGKMKLGEYLQWRRNIFGRYGSARLFAHKLGIHEQHLSRIANGKLTPSFNLLKRIVEATNGEVTLKDFTEKKK